MFSRKAVKTKLDEAIDLVLSEMQTISSDSDEYAKMIVQLERLYKLKEIDSPKRVSPDTLAIVAGNLAGILLILNFERAGVVTSKALSFVMKLR